MATFFSPDFNLLDYYFWNEVKEKVYSGHDTKYFETERQDVLYIRPMCYKCGTTW